MHRSTPRPTPRTTPQLVWQCQGHSVLGASHQRSGLPNQDAIAWSPESGTGPPLILAIADGHGSAKSFRSHRGSKLAVQVAIREISKAFQLQQGANSLTLIQAEAIAAQLPQAIVQRWQQLVQAELQSDPIVTSEWEHLQVKEGQTACGRVEQQPLLAYGATLLTVFVTDSFMLFFQLGDGDMLCVNHQGQVSLPLDKDSRLIANETTSLCQDQAWKSVRWRLVPLTEPDIPELILLSTDGYANCFVTEADFQQIGPDYQQMLREQGLSQVIAQLPVILNQASQRGSGDDITLGMLLRQTANAASAPATTQVRRSPNVTETSTVPAPHRPVSSALEPAQPAPGLPQAITTSENLQILRQRNQQQQQEIKRLRFWLNILLATTIVSGVLAALSFWRLYASTNQPKPTASASSTPSTSPTDTQKPKPAPSDQWLLQVQGQDALRLKVGQQLVSNPQQPGKIFLQDKPFWGILLGQSCRECKLLAEVSTQEDGWVLKNVSGQTWQVNLPNQPPRTIRNSEEISLRPNLKIDFGDRLKANLQQVPPPTPGNSNRPTPNPTDSPHPTR